MTIDAQTAYDDAQAQEAQVTDDEIQARSGAEPMQQRPYEALSDHTLAVDIVDLDEAIASLVRVRDEKRIEVQRRIEDAGATMLDDDEFTIELKPGPVSWDVGILQTLIRDEYLSAETLAKVYTSADERRERMEVAAKWDGTQLNALARHHGGAIRSIVERARSHGVPKVVVAKK